MSNILHLIGSYPLVVGLVSQVVVLLSSLKSKDKAAAIQGSLLMGALGLITVSILLRPKSPPNLTADIFGCVGAVLLLTPGIQALLKLRKKQNA